MKNKLESRFILSVFDKIRRFGQKNDNGYLLDGINASTDFDGYTIYIEDARVNLQFGFHNQYHLDYQSQDDFDSFSKKLKDIHLNY